MRSKLEGIDARAVLRAMFDAAVDAAQPKNAVRQHLPVPPKGRTVVIGAGKASSQMAQAIEDAWPGAVAGVVVTPYGHVTTCRQIDVLEASHPVPDTASIEASRRLTEAVSDLTADDLVVALISGGGSSLLAAPATCLSLEDEAEINRALLRSGAPIGAMNVIRNQFSTIKGGRLALAAGPARVVTLVLSDIPGDDASLVASGPTVPIAGDRISARSLVETYAIDLPAAALDLLRTEDNLPPVVDDIRLARNTVSLIASAEVSLNAAKAVASFHGLPCHILSDAIEGEARDAGRFHGALARRVRSLGQPFSTPAVILSGGETTVTLRNMAGTGGRNSEFLLAFAIAIDGVDGIVGLAADTDGIDGSGRNAGAFADGSTVRRMRAAGIDPLLHLARNDSASAFSAIGDLLMTGPTGTNVNDFRALWIS